MNCIKIYFYMFYVITLLMSNFNVKAFDKLNKLKETMKEFQRKSSDLRHKLKSGVRLKYDGPSDEIRYSPIKHLEYPGKNIEKLANITELWELYYDCLEFQYSTLGHHRRIPPIAILVLENLNVKLQCDLCQSPQQANEPVMWFKLDSPYGKPQIVDETEHIIITQDDVLEIYRAQREFAGIYYCQSGDTRTNPYYLHVFGDNEKLVEVKPETAKKGPYAETDITLKHNIRVTTTWSSWTKCSRCGKVGKKKRYGACTVVANITSDIQEDRLLDALKMGEDSSEEGYLGFLLLLTQGLPCRSRLLPFWIRKINELDRANEVMVSYCKKPCSDIIFQVKDDLGNIVDFVNNSAGIFSALQGPPHVLPMVTRATMYCPLEQPAVVFCPGILYTDAPIEWYVNKTIQINPWIVKKETNGRISIDSRDRLSFRSIQDEDAKIYTCKQCGEISSVVRLVAYDANTVNIDHHVVLVGIIAVLALFLYLFVRIYLNKTRAAVLYL